MRACYLHILCKLWTIWALPFNSQSFEDTHMQFIKLRPLFSPSMQYIYCPFYCKWGTGWVKWSREKWWLHPLRIPLRAGKFIIGWCHRGWLTRDTWLVNGKRTVHFTLSINYRYRPMAWQHLPTHKLNSTARI